MSPLRSLAPGWLLAKQPDKAAQYVQNGYPANGGTYPRPRLDFIERIFSEVWPALQQDKAFSQAMDDGEKLLKQVQAAEGMLADGLRHIQQRYEGGEPPV
jgi:hypothetical protein